MQDSLPISRQDSLETIADNEPETEFSIIIPCYNEEGAILVTIDEISKQIDHRMHYEIICVDDGSTDGTSGALQAACLSNSSIRLMTHDFNQGYGAALKTGIRSARSDIIVITDADGTYPIDRIVDLLAQLESNDMVVGSRIGPDVVYPLMRRIPKAFLRVYASWLSGRNIPDINSGLRVFRRSAVAPFIRILPDGFSFTTTITIAMLTNNYRVHYVPISYHPRIGRSKIRPVRDTLNFLQLILRTGLYFAPLRVFLPIIAVLGLSFLGSVAYDLFWLNDITDKSLMLFLGTANTTMFALLADMMDKRCG